MSTISTSVQRTDSRDKSGGSSRYLDDLDLGSALTGRLLLSTRAHAKIAGIELPELPDGYVIVDHHDIPGRNGVQMINDQWPLFPVDTVDYVAQPILMIAGPSLDVVDRLISAITVTYEELDPVPGITAAEASDPPPMFVEYTISGSPGPEQSEAQSERSDAQTGESAKPGAGAEIALEETFDTGAQEQLYLEPQAMAAVFEDDRITVTGSLQCPFYVHKALVPLFGWEKDRFRVIQATTGGAFGGKEEFPSVLAGYVALGAYKSGKPVKLVLDREQDIEISTKRHPSRITFASTTRDGAIESICADVRLDAGAYEGLSSTVLQRAIFSITGVYRVAEASIRGRAYRTNVVPYGAFRGFGSPQAFFAAEMHLCHLATRNGEDALDFKRRNLVQQGDRTLTGGVFRDPIKLEQMIDSLVSQSGYRRKRSGYAEVAAGTGALDHAGTTRRGIGVSIFSHGCGFTGSGERDIIKAKVRLRATANGTVEILCANVEMGQGAQTTLRKIVAQTLETPLDQVVFENPDTDDVPDSGPTVASRTSMVVGGLLHKAALKLKSLPPAQDAPVEVEADYEQPGEIEWDQETFRGDAYPAFSWGVNIIEVEVDTLTWTVTPVEVWAAYDIGTAIDEKIVVGQIHGGLTQGLGYGLTELLELKDGRFRQRTMTDYIVPGSLDAVKMNVELVSNPYHGGPFGAKGVGEIPITGAAPALADAVENALGIEVHQIPMTPEYLETLVRQTGSSGQGAER